MVDVAIDTMLEIVSCVNPNDIQFIPLLDILYSNLMALGTIIPTVRKDTEQMKKLARLYSDSSTLTFKLSCITFTS